MNEKKPILPIEKLQSVTDRFPTPFYVYDEKAIRENARKLQKAFSWNKGYKEFFAVKATPNPYIIKLLAEEGCGVDCSSRTELMIARACGLSGHDIMFSSNDTPAGEFTFCKELGGIINLDDATMVDFLNDECGVPETVCLRYNPGGIYEVSNGIMDNPGDAKYGMTKPQLIESVKRLKELGAKRFGIHAFLVSNTTNNDYYPKLAGTMFELALEIREQTGVSVSFVNLSGGIGIPYRPEGDTPDIFAIGEGVRKNYEEILTKNGFGDVSIYTELGRFMLAPYGQLVTKIIHEKHTYKEYLGVDACAVNLMRPAMYGAYHHITIYGKENEKPCKTYDVVGSLCENNDKFAINRELPEAEVGDTIVIYDAGAHGFAMGYNYNGKLKCAELLYEENGDVKMIRRAETAEDYFATFDFSKDFNFFGK